MSELTYKSYNDKSFAVRGDRAVHDHLLKKIGARWNSRMKGGEGWMVNKADEEALIAVIADYTKSQRLDEIANSARSRKGQDKYHRGESDGESDGEKSQDESERSDEENRSTDEHERSESDTSPVRRRSSTPKHATRQDSEDKRKAMKRENRKALEEEIAKLEAKDAKKGSRHTNKRSEDPMGYYKSYGKKPKDFRELYSSPQRSYSSSDDSSVSDDDFPSPGSPRKRHQNTRDDDDMKSMRSRIDSMQKRLYEIEIKTKGLPMRKKGGR